MLDAVFNTVADLFGRAQQALFEGVVQPLVFGAGFGNLLEDAFDATGWLLVGLLEVLLLVSVLRTLERRWPAEPVTDRRAVRTDIVYTLLHRLGLFRVGLFFAVQPLFDWLFGEASLAGFAPWQLDAAIAPWWPGVTDTAWCAFLAYLLVFDFVDYWVHRAQHGWHWWWSLHALHHSQRQMTLWSDDRNHLVDDLLRAAVAALVARAIGIAPGQFIAIVALTQLLESLAHANTRLDFGPTLARVLVGPRFHRVHHHIGYGHEAAGRDTLGGHNFAVLFPLWDIVFRTADFTRPIGPTGVRDQLPEEGGRDYGQGFWSQQWRGLLRLAGADRPLAARGAAVPPERRDVGVSSS